LIVLGQDHEIAAAIVLDAALDRLEQDAGSRRFATLLKSAMERA
jgi:hypothetical protein